MSIFYVYDKSTGLPAGSGITAIDNETHGSTLIPLPPAEGGMEPVWHNGAWSVAVPAWRVHAIIAIRGLTASVAAVLESLPDPQRIVAKAAWGGNYLFPNSPLVLAAAGALGLTDEDLAGIFEDAAAIEA